MRDKDREFILLLQGGVFFFFRLDTKEKEPKRKYLRLTLKNEAGKPCGVFVRWVWGRGKRWWNFGKMVTLSDINSDGICSRY